jgi:hypothetical protein
VVFLQAWGRGILHPWLFVLLLPRCLRKQACDQAPTFPEAPFPPQCLFPGINYPCSSSVTVSHHLESPGLPVLSCECIPAGLS